MVSRTAEHAEVIRRRLTSQFLTTPGPKTASEVVRALGAVQAQDYAGAKWALGIRTRVETDASIDRQVDSGKILRTHVLRPTWHFVSPGDIRWMLALTGPRVKQSMSYHGRTLEIDAKTVRKSHDAITSALSDGRHLTRLELAEALTRAGVKNATGQKLAHLVMEAELDALIVNGARRGKQSTYALLDERVPASQPLPRDEALHKLATIYFTTRGPATVKDFSWWSGLPMADAKRAVEMVRGELAMRVVNGENAWFDPGVTPKPAKGALLLPNYDEYFIGYTDRSAIGKRVNGTTAVTGGTADLTHVAFIDGELVGGWKRLMDKNGVVVALELSCELTRLESGRIERVVDALGEFLGAPVAIGEQADRRTGRHKSSRGT